MNRQHAVLAIVAMFVVVGIPLTFASVTSGTKELRESTVSSVAGSWTAAEGWELLQVSTTYHGVVVRTTGPMPLPDVEPLKRLLTEAGIDPADVEVDLVPSYIVKLDDP